MMIPVTQDGYQLLQDGVIALTDIEAHGMRVDLKYMDRMTRELKTSMGELTSKMQKDAVWKRWRRRFGEKAKITSRDQLAIILFDEMGYKVTATTESGEAATDVSALEQIDLEFVRDFVRLMKYEKAHGTYLRGVRREVVGDRIHPVFNLHTVVTYRSSSDTPNFQNMPVRDPEIARIVRRCFIPSPGCVITENDYSGVEVRVATCYHRDPVMISYIKDTTKDMHRDMAAQIYKLTPEWVKDHGKEHRYGAKNKFVFPQFYGDFYVTCAKSLWEWMERAKLKAPGDVALRDHLRKHGITELGPVDLDSDDYQSAGKHTFVNHLREVENDFWNNRFKVYGRWKRKWWDLYQEQGYVDLLTGFRIEGVYRKNEIINYPVQGAAFHCLLWSLIRINKALKKYKMKSRVAGQIHDSIIGDVRTEELSDYLSIVREVMVERIKKSYDWLLVPLDIENEITPSVGTWYDKVGTEFKDGIYTFKDKEGNKSSFDRPEAFINFLDLQFNKSRTK